MLNKALLIGYLGKDPETGESTRGGRWCRLSLATSRRWRDKATQEKREQTQWHRIVVWGDALAQLCQKSLRKGSRVWIEGEIQTRTYTDDRDIERTVTEIVVQPFNGSIKFLDSRDTSGDVPEPEHPDYS